MASRFKKSSNRLYEQEAVSPLSLRGAGGSGGILLQKILKFQSPTMRFPAFWSTEKSVFFSKENVAFV